MQVIASIGKRPTIYIESFKRLVFIEERVGLKNKLPLLGYQLAMGYSTL